MRVLHVEWCVEGDIWDRGATQGPKFASERLASDVGVSPQMGRRGLRFAKVHSDVRDIGTIPGESHEMRSHETTKNVGE
jgi:hypothetical protein